MLKWDVHILKILKFFSLACLKLMNNICNKRMHFCRSNFRFHLVHFWLLILNRPEDMWTSNGNGQKQEFKGIRKDNRISKTNEEPVITW